MLIKRRGKQIFFLLLLGGLAVWGYRLVTRSVPVRVVVRAVDRGPVEKTVVNTRAGTVKPCRRAQLSPEMGGIINRWPVREGMTVKEGDLLLELWNEDALASVTLAESELEATQARAEAACLQSEVAERDARRYRELNSVGAAAKERIDEVLTTAKVRQAECRSAKAQNAVAQSRVFLARSLLEKTRLRAPFSGIVAELNGELGEYVTPSPPGIKTLPIVDLIDPSCYYVLAPIDEVDAPAVHAGMPVRIALDAFKGKIFPGRVLRVADYVLDLEKQARTVDIEVVFENALETVGLLAGFSADAEVVLEARLAVLRAPTEAIMDGERVYVHDPISRQLVGKKVVTGVANWQFTEIVSGELKEGDLIVLSLERQGIKDGAPAEVEDKD